MINSRISQIIIRSATRLNYRSVQMLAKEVPSKGGKKAEEVPAVIQEEPIESIVIKWLQSNHQPLSPSQLHNYTQGFQDLATKDREILDSLAQKILDLPTAVLFEVMKKGGLGTSQLYYTSVSPLEQVEVPETIRHLRKQM